jgi:hypothetical protein
VRRKLAVTDACAPTALRLGNQWLHREAVGTLAECFTHVRHATESRDGLLDRKGHGHDPYDPYDPGLAPRSI